MRKLLAAVIAYLVLYAGVAFLWLMYTNEAQARSRRVVELGEQHAAELKAVDNLPSLHEACKGKLEPGGARTIAAYVAKTGAKPQDDNTWDEALVGVQHVWDDDDLVTLHSNGFPPIEPKRALLDNLSPFDWKRHLLYAKAGSPELGETRYLLVAKYVSLSLPVNQGTDGYTRGSGDFAARVLRFPTGEILCVGRGEVHMKETVNASARAATKEQAEAEAQANAAKLVPFVFSRSVVTSPLHALCDMGGEGLCKLTAQWVGR